MREFTTICACDRCGATDARTTKHPYYRLPDGWGHVQADGYRGWVDLCPACFAPIAEAYERNNAKRDAQWS